MPSERVAMFCAMGEHHIGAGYVATAVAINPADPL
jgi:hypothetical protein